MRVLLQNPTALRVASVVAIVFAGTFAFAALNGSGPFAKVPKAQSAAAGWSGFSADSLPGANWRPYSPRSPFNTKIPAKVRVHPRSKQYVSQMLQWSLPAPIVGGDGGTNADYAHPTYWARPSDPVYRLQPSTNWGHAHIQGQRIHIPTGARAAPGSDGHMTVVQPDGWEYDFWRAGNVSGSGGVFNYASGARIRVNGLGIKAGATASNFGNLAGIIRAPELAAGKINHALFMVIRCTSGDTSFGFGARRPRGGGSAFVYPATGGGSSCRSGESSPPLGARVRLAMTDKKIRSLGVPAWKRAILRALARYGAYIGDTGGPGVALMTESSLTYTAFGQADPLVTLGQKRQSAGDGSVKRSGGGKFAFDVSGEVDWLSKLKVIAPPKR